MSCVTYMSVMVNRTRVKKMLDKFV